MSERGELWGHRLEFAGLLCVLLVTFWQSVATDWWDEQLREWEFQIQENVNLTVMSSMERLVAIQTEGDAQVRKVLANTVHDETARAISDMIKERERRDQQMSRGQAALFGTIRKCLLMIGGALFLLGKWFTLRAVASRIASSRRDSLVTRS